MFLGVSVLNMYHSSYVLIFYSEFGPTSLQISQIRIFIFSFIIDVVRTVFWLSLLLIFFFISLNFAIFFSSALFCGDHVCWVNWTFILLFSVRRYFFLRSKNSLKKQLRNKMRIDAVDKIFILDSGKWVKSVKNKLKSVFEYNFTKIKYSGIFRFSFQTLNTDYRPRFIVVAVAAASVDVPVIFEWKWNDRIQINRANWQPKIKLSFSTVMFVSILFGWKSIEERVFSQHTDTMKR